MDLHSATIEAYLAVGIASDRLPYSHDIDRLLDHLRAIGHDVDRLTAWQTLRDLRKRSLLPHVGRGANNRLALPSADIVLRCYRILGVRWDRLPYTEAMDHLVAMVREQAPGLVTY